MKRFEPNSGREKSASPRRLAQFEHFGEGLAAVVFSNHRGGGDRGNGTLQADEDGAAMRQLLHLFRGKGDAPAGGDRGQQSGQVFDAWDETGSEARLLARVGNRCVAAGEQILVKTDEGFAFQLTERDARPPGQPVIFRQDGLEGNPAQDGDLEFAIEVGAGVAEERKVDAAIAQAAHLVQRCELFETHFRIPVLAGELFQGGREDFGEDGRDVADGKTLGGALPEGIHVRGGLGGFAEDATGMGEKTFTGVSQGQAIVAADEQGYAEFLFQITQLPADRGLRNAQTGRCPAHVQFLCHRYKIAQMPEFHGGTYNQKTWLEKAQDSGFVPPVR